MADDMPDPAEDPELAEDGGGRPWWQWAGVILLAIPVALLLLAPPALWFLSETAAGRAFVARQAARVTLQSGLHFTVDRIDGSLFSTFTLTDTTIHDLDGPLATIPRAAVTWKPRDLLGGVFSFDSVTVPEVRLARLPHLNPSPPDEPLLPDIHLEIGRFAIDRLILAPAVAGRREELALAGRATMRKGRLITSVAADATAGDRLRLNVNAVPDDNLLDLAARLDAPADGLLMRLAGLEQPLHLTLAGKGDWTRWRGALDGTLGGKTLGHLALAADAGRFRVKGTLHPALVLPADVAPAVSPAVAVDFTGEGAGDWLLLALDASSPAFRVAASGKLDPTRNRIEDVRAKLSVTDAARLHPDLVAAGLAADLTARGKLAAPDASFNLRAARLAWGNADAAPLGAENLRLSGTLREKSGRFTLPFHLTAARILGLSPENAALLAHPDAKGTLEYAGGTLTLKSLDAETAALKANATAALSPDGQAEGRVKATLKRYVVAGFGTVSGGVDARFVQRPGQTLPEAQGSFTGRALALDPGTARDLFGTLPEVAGQFAFDRNQTFTLSKATLKSRDFNLGAYARYAMKTGVFAAAATGASRAYGPLDVKAAGTLDKPYATLVMARPGFGIGLTNLRAELRPGYDILVHGTTPQGPLTGDLRVDYKAGAPLGITIRDATFAGMRAQGTLRQTAAGPFTGTLTARGHGFGARADLTAAGAAQAARIHATANRARIPVPGETADAAITIRDGIIDLALTLGKTPDIAGGFHLKGVAYDSLSLADARGRVDLHGLAGTASATIDGAAATVPFRADARLSSIDNGYALTLAGTVNKLAVKLAEPARILRLKNGWQLMPATIALPRGTIGLAGTMANDSRLDLRIRDVKLGTLNAIRPGLGLAGTMNGGATLVWAKNAALPTGRASLNVANMTRAGMTGVSMPVDVAVAAELEPRELKGAARITSGAKTTGGAKTLGRATVALVPAASGAAGARLMHGRLSGGVRYSGPVSPLWALAAPEGQELRGALAVGVDLAGTPANPVFDGVTHGRNIVYSFTDFGTRIEGIAFDGRFSGSTFTLTRFDGKAGKGTISAQGTASLRDGKPEIAMTATFAKAQLAHNDTANVVVSGPLEVRSSAGAIGVAGTITIDSADIVLAPFSMSDVPTLDVRRAGAAPASARDAPSMSRIGLDIRVQSAADTIRVEGMGLDSAWGANIRIRGTATDPSLRGSTTLDHGTFNFASSEFRITSGRLTFNGAPMQSAINLQAETQAQDVVASIRISGTAEHPQVSFSSTPTLPEDEILSRLLFGTSVADLSVTEAVQLASAVNGLRTGGLDTIGKMRRSIGLDQLKLVGGDGNGMGTGIAVGKKLVKGVYMEVTTDTQGNTLTQLQFTLTRVLSLFTEVSSLGNDSVNLRYQREH